MIQFRIICNAAPKPFCFILTGDTHSASYSRTPPPPDHHPIPPAPPKHELISITCVQITQNLRIKWKCQLGIATLRVYHCIWTQSKHNWRAARTRRLLKQGGLLASFYLSISNRYPEFHTIIFSFFLLFFLQIWGQFFCLCCYRKWRDICMKFS